MIEDDLRAAFVRHEPLTPPPGPLRAAIDRLAVRRRRRRRNWRAGGVALALLGVLGIGVPLFTPDPSRSPAPAELLGDPGRPAPVGALTILLLGLDGTGATSAPPRADSLLILHIPADRSRPYLMSVPRDLELPIPGHGTDKVNAAFALGAGLDRPDLARGYELTRRTVEELTGTSIDAGVVLTYAALRTLTDAVGGVPVCLPWKVRSVHSGRIFPAGCQRLDGAASMDLLRQRYGLPEGGRDRDQTARLFAAALLRQATDRDVLTDPVRLAALLGALEPDLTVAPDRTTVLDLMRVIPRLATAEPVGLDVPTTEPTGPSYHLRPAPRLMPELRTALREDRLGEWAARHPGLVDGTD
ncbi:LCP family protein [Micromonospora sp. GCM10011542]|uniref:LCP family protein n=1 Tax=Micromonospora sp. GCM10011542 TaxID=3317337 RepID=UPI003614C35B